MMFLYGLECSTACALMVIVMLVHLDHSTGSHASHQKHVYGTQVKISG